MTIKRDGSIKIEKDEQLVRLPSDGKNPPSDSSSHASIVFKPLASEIERSWAARAFDEKKPLNRSLTMQFLPILQANAYEFIRERHDVVQYK